MNRMRLASSVALEELLKAGIPEPTAKERASHVAFVSYRVDGEDASLFQDVRNVVRAIGKSHCPGPVLSVESVDVITAAIVAALQKEGFR